MTAVTSVLITEEARRYLTARTAAELPRKKSSDRGALFSELCEGARLFMHHVWEDAEDLKVDGPAARALVASATEPTSEPSLRTWAVMLRMSRHRGSGVAYLAQRLGLEKAFEALLDASLIDVDADLKKGRTSLLLRPTPHPLFESGIDALVLGADPQARRRALALADARWDGAAFVEKMILVEARFDRPEWADALASEWLLRTRRDGEGWRVLIARIGSLDLARLLLRDGVSASVVDLVRFGDAALPILIEALSAAKDAHALKHLSRAIALYDDPRAAAALASVATRSPAQPFVLDFFQRHPEYAEEVLAPLGEGKSKAAEKVRELLVRVAPTAPKAPREERTKEQPKAPGKPKEQAKAESAIPEVLLAPPWAKSASKKKRAPIVVPPFTVPCLDVLLPDPEADDQMRAELSSTLAHPLDDAEKKKLLAWVDSPQPDGMVGQWVQLPRPEAIALYARWPEHRRHLMGMEREAIALFGLEALDGLVRQAARDLEREYPPTWVLRLGTPRLALVLLGAAHESDQASLVGDWLAAHREAAIAGILPIAVGPLGDARTLAEQGLIELARLHGREAVLLRAPSGEVREACEEIWAHAVHTFGPGRPPKVSAELAGLPAVRLRAGGVLDDAAVETLLGYLSVSTLALRHPALAAVSEACEPRDFAELAWTLARSWEIGRGKKAKSWMIDALAALADDDVVRRVLPGLKKARALSVLGTIATDAAAIELISATEGGAFAYQAQRELSRIALRRGLSVDVLEESLAPSFLEGNTLALRLGGQDYTVRLDARLAVIIEDTAGKVSRRLPPSTGDDEHDARMRARYTELVADVARLTPRRLRILERRMILGDTMSLEELLTRHLHHPLWASLARGLVWSWLLPDGRTGTFRITDDGSFEDDHEEVVSLTEVERQSARFGLPHPLRLPPAVLGRWATLLSDYGIVQPFPQIGRAVVAPSEEELRAGTLKRPATFGADQHGPGPLDRGLPGSGPRGWSYRIALAGGRVLTLSGPKAPPFFVEVSLTGEGPIPENLAIEVAEHFHALGA